MMVGRRGLLLVSVALELGCTPNFALELPSWETLDGADSFLLLQSEHEQVVAAWANEPAAGGSWAPGLKLNEAAPTQLYLLAYAATLADLGLHVGEIRLDPEGASLPVNAKLWQSKIEAGSQRPWSELAMAPDHLQAVRIHHEAGGCSLLGTFSKQERTIEGTQTKSGGFLLPQPDDTALAIAAGALWRVSVAAIEPLASITDTSTSPVIGGYRAESGELYFLQEDGALWRGDFEHGFVAEPPAPLALKGRAAWLDGARGGAPFEIYVVSNQAGLLHFDGAWRELIPPQPETDLLWKGGVVWMGPGQAYASGPLDRSVIWVHDGTFELVGSMEIDSPTALTQLPDGRALAASSSGLFAIDGRVVRQIGPIPALSTVMAAPFERGTIFGGQLGVLAYLPDNGAPCPPESVTSPSTVAVAPISIGYFMLSASVFGEVAPASITTLRRRR